MAMLGLEEAQQRLLQLATLMAVEELAVEAAMGRYLAQDLTAMRTQPSADLSAMDGYAICGEGPWALKGESRAGAPFAGSLSAGETVRISTGAHLPPGADRILIQENASVEGPRVSCTQAPPRPQQHVRAHGFDFAEGDVLLSAGTQIGPAQIALALSAGHAQVRVLRAPSVAVLDSGDELAANPGICRGDQIPASNGAMLAAMIRGFGCQVNRIGPVADDEQALARALERAESADILVTSGGASVGDHDLIRPALERWGAGIDFWKVAMKPGKPLMVARRGEQVILGLPGNPVSCFVTAMLFLLPLIRASMGASQPLPARFMARLGSALPATGSRHEFPRGIWDGREVVLAGSQDSSALRSLALANCLIDRPTNADEAEAGTYVPVILLENGGTA